jgi:hypothetical protein
MKAVGRVIPRTMGAEIGLPQFVENRTKRTGIESSIYLFRVLNRDCLDCSVTQIDQEVMPRGLREAIDEMQNSRVLGGAKYDWIAETEALLSTCVAWARLTRLCFYRRASRSIRSSCRRECSEPV